MVEGSIMMKEFDSEDGKIKNYGIFLGYTIINASVRNRTGPTGPICFYFKILWVIIFK